MTLKFYYDLLSQPSRALYIFLKVCNIPFEKRVVNLASREQHQPEFEAINPFKKVPAIQHNDFSLFESVAITRYIAREFSIPPHWYPIDTKGQAKVDEYLEWQHLNTRLHCATYFIVEYLTPRITGKPPKPEKLEQCKDRMTHCLDEIENVWLKNKSFLTGNGITVADIFGACEIEQIRMAGYDPREGRPRMAAWLNKVAEQTSPYYQEAHKYLNQIAARHNEKRSNI